MISRIWHFTMHLAFRVLESVCISCTKEGDEEKKERKLEEFCTALIEHTMKGNITAMQGIRYTFSYPNWMFVFMGSVNYISRSHGSFPNCVTCHVMTSTEGTDGKQCHECPLYDLIGFQWLPIWSPKAGTTSLPAISLETTCIWYVWQLTRTWANKGLMNP